MPDTQFHGGYQRAERVNQDRPSGTSAADWFAHPRNRPSPGDSPDFRDGYVKRVFEIAEVEGWTPIGPWRPETPVTRRMDLEANMTVAHVVCCNDSIEAVVLDDEVKANKVLDRLKLEHYQRSRSNFGSETEYQDVCYWHLHTKEVTG